jgi:hypothetical protein
MVKQGIVLGHVISERGIEVDKAKLETVEQLPPPTDVKSLRSFLGHAGFDHLSRMNHGQDSDKMRDDHLYRVLDKDTWMIDII